MSAPEKQQPTNKGLERRSLVEKSRPLLGFGLRLAFLWVATAVVSIVLAILFHSPFIPVVGIIIAFTDFIEFATSKLWRKLCTAPNGLTATHAAQVAGIHSHSDIFLQELGHTALQAYPQAYFQAALAALIAPPTTPATAAITWLDGVP